MQRVRRPANMTNNIRALREERGLSQRGLARLAGVDDAQLSRWERGRQGIYIESAFALARALGVDLVALGLDQGAPPAQPAEAAP